MGDLEFSNEYESFDDFAELDPATSHLIAVFGKKGSGKTQFCTSIYNSFDGDKLAIDVNGDIDPGDDAVLITDPLPDYFPVSPDGEPRNLHYIANPLSPTYREGLDKAVGLGLFPKENHTLLFLDEIGEFTTGNRTDPRLRTLLMQSRHYHCSALMAGPRPMDVDKLVIAQADMVVIYDLPDPDDQAKIAKIIAYPLERFTRAIAEMRDLGPHHHLVYVSAKCSKTGQARLALCDPIEL